MVRKVIPEHLCDIIVALVEERHSTFFIPGESVSFSNLVPSFSQLSWVSMKNDLRAAICNAIDMPPTHKAVQTVRIERFLTADFLPPMHCGRNIGDTTEEYREIVQLWCLTDSGCDGITFIQESQVIRQLDRKGHCFCVGDFDWLWVSPVLGLSRYTLSIRY